MPFLFPLLQTQLCFVEVYYDIPQNADGPSLQQLKCEPKDDQVIKQNEKIKFHQNKKLKFH